VTLIIVEQTATLRDHCAEELIETKEEVGETVELEEE